MDELKKVAYIQKKQRSGETFVTALKNRLLETAEIGTTGYHRDIVISVPHALVTGNVHARKLLSLAGDINRNKEFNLPVALESKQVTDKDGNPIVILDVVFSISQDTDIQGVIALIR